MGIYIGTMASVPSSVQPLAAGCFIGAKWVVHLRSVVRVRGWERTLSATHLACETISMMQLRLRHHHSISMHVIHVVCIVSTARSGF
jgi:hypothetical protein